MELVAPIVPDSQKNKAPELLLEGLRTGLAAFAQFAQIRRQTESEVARLAQHERLAQDQMNFNREKLAADTNVQSTYYEAMGKAANTRADAYAKGLKGMVSQDELKAEFQQGFQERVAELRLNDPNLEKDDPAQFYLNAEELNKNYGTSTLPGIRQALRAYKLRSEQHKIQLPQITYGEDGTPAKAGKVAPRVVVGEIVKGLHDPATRKEYMDRLKAGGYIKPGGERPTGKKIPGAWWQKAWDEMEQAPDEIVPHVEDLINKADTADFGSGAVVPQPDFSRKAREFRAAPEDIDPNASADPASSATPETDRILKSAIDALRRGASPKAVAARLQDEYGIDPNQLWAT